MTDVLFVQGAGDRVHDDWDHKLVESLRRELGPHYDVRYPRMPNEADPQLRTWRPVLERELAALRADGVIVGHSVGGTLMLHVLGDSKLARKPRTMFFDSSMRSTRTTNRRSPTRASRSAPAEAQASEAATPRMSAA